jgi:hypothetical protein
MTDARTKEAIRYLGYGRHAVDEQTLALIDVSFGELDQTTQAKSVYRIFDCKVTGEDQVTIGKKQKSRKESQRLQRGSCIWRNTRYQCRYTDETLFTDRYGEICRIAGMCSCISGGVL